MTTTAAIILAVTSIVFLSLIGWLMSRMGTSEIQRNKRAGGDGGSTAVVGGGDGGCGGGDGGGAC